MKRTGDCRLSHDKGIAFTKSDIVPKWFIKGFKDGPNGGYYMDLLGGKPGEIAGACLAPSCRMARKSR